MQVIAAKAVAFLEALDPAFTKYQEQVLDNAKAMAKVFLARGYELVSGGTKNHLMLLNLVNKNLTGRAADAALSRAYITVNKNAVPDDPQPASVTSGIRIGTPAITTRGFKQAEAKQVATWICDILDDIDNEEVIRSGARPCIAPSATGPIPASLTRASSATAAKSAAVANAPTPPAPPASPPTKPQKSRCRW